MKFKVEVDFSKANALFARLTGPEAKQAMAEALNDAAWEGRRVLQQEVERSFDRPTPYIRRSIQVSRKATPDKLEAVVSAEYMGGKGIEPEKILQAEIFGGPRRPKRSEVALRRVGILPDGYFLVPGQACPLDQYGNVKGSFIVQLISYFQAFGEQGYRANMTDRRKAKLRNKGKTERGYATTMGVRYFISYGKLRSGPTEHLHPGIWSAKGIHDSNVEPILMFVKAPSYRKRLDFFGKPVQAAIDKFNPRLRFRMRSILERRA